MVPEDNEEALLLARLQAQFGDMDLSALTINGANDDTQNSAHADNEEENEADKTQQEENVPSEESSAVSPTPEELQAWQEAQYKLGKWAKEAKEQASKSQSEKIAQALRKRRQHTKQQVALHLSSKGYDSDEWEEIFTPPSLGTQHSMFFTSSPTEEGIEIVGTHPLLTQLAAHGDPEVLGGQWKLLYSSNVDGLSFHKLLDVLRGYGGPTVTLIGAVPAEQHRLDKNSANKSDAAGGTLGFFTTCAWKGEDDGRFFGNDDCFLFRFRNENETNDDEGGDYTATPPPPQVSILRPITSKGNYMYCNPSSSSTGGKPNQKEIQGDGIQYGLGVGGTSSRLRLHLTETFESCRACTLTEGTFAQGHLLPPSWAEDCLYYFDADALEVWGVGGEEWIELSLKEQFKNREKMEANLKKVRQVDKMQLLDHFRSDPLANLSNHRGFFSHVDQVQGRMEDCRMMYDC